VLRKDRVDAAFGQFLRLLAWVAFEEGTHVERGDLSGTGQTCLEWERNGCERPIDTRMRSPRV